LDTGIDFNHPDFAGRFAGGNDTASFVPGVSSAQDGNGHGTHCAGVIAGAAASSGQRRYSVAPDAELLIGKVLDDGGSGFDDQILDGIDWAADSGAQIISMSLGSGRNSGDPYSDPYEVVAGNLLAMMPGTLMVAAAGNESARPAFIAAVGNPASCPSILAVAAVDRFKRVADFSCGQRDNIGFVDVAAPGLGVYSAWTGGGFNTISGTSMATPHVAGLAALLLEVQPDLSANQLWKRLGELCESLSTPEDFGKGLVQAP
jgi:subtilisin family serine protease